jgi:myo-inositol 2-dehydrogenase/D-chiro-inositol 1-dehydrogenase
MHYEVGMKVLGRGLPLFVEKPPAPSLQQAGELVDVARGNGVFVMPAFMKRHGMPYAKAREMIECGEFVPAAGFFRFGHWPSTSLRPMLLGMSIHVIDLAISFFGEVASVTSCLYKSARAISLGVTLRFRSGKIAQLMLDSSQPRIQERIELSGTLDGGNALIIVDNVHHMEVHRQGQHGIDLLAPSLAEVQPEFDLQDVRIWRPDYGIPNMGQTRHFFQGYAGEVREFADAIIERREPYPGTDDTLKAMRVIEAIVAEPNGTTDLPD